MNLELICFNSLSDTTGTILNSSICLPASKAAHTSRSHLAVNLLSCITTLAIQPSPSPSLGVMAGGVKRKYDKVDFHAVLRFNGRRCF